MQESEKNKLQGIVVFLKTNEGSKSEALVPFLYRGKEVPPQKILLKNDNPFENNGFASYDGKTVELSGSTALSGTFIADEITVSENQK